MSDYSPLFEPGFHDIAIAELDDIFVIPFNDSSRRQELTAKLKLFISQLLEIDVKFEIWIDGSYVTKKTSPGDIDMAVIFNPDEVNNLPAHHQEFMGTDPRINKVRYGLDVYFVPNDFHRKSYWKGLFGFTREEQPKGIPRLYLGGAK